MEISSDKDIEMKRAKIEVKFVYPKVENYSEPQLSGQVYLDCKINNIAKVTENDPIFTPSAMIRDLPFVLSVTRIAKKTKTKQSSPYVHPVYPQRTSVDMLRFSLLVNGGFKWWKCNFLVLFRTMDNETNRRFEKKINATLKDTQNSVHHDISFDLVASLDTFFLKC